MRRQELIDYIEEEYGVKPIHPWRSYPAYCTFPHQENDSSFAIIMQVTADKLGLAGNQEIDIVNLKGNPELVSILSGQEGFAPAYHMNRRHWISVRLDGTAPDQEIRSLLEESFNMTLPKGARKRAGRSWLIPANPRYFDVDAAFRREDVIVFKQSSRVIPGDMIYMYVGAPVSALRYRCRAVEVDIPWTSRNEKVKLKKVMRIEKLAEYPADEFTWPRLKEDYGIFAVRGPRGIPEELKNDLEYWEKTHGGKL